MVNVELCANQCRQSTIPPPPSDSGRAKSPRELPCIPDQKQAHMRRGTLLDNPRWFRGAQTHASILALTLALGACSDRVIAPIAQPTGPAGRGNIAPQCYEAFYDCGDPNPLTWGSGGGGGGCDPTLDFTHVCTTRGFNTSELNDIRSALWRISSDCGWARTYLNNLLSHGRLGAATLIDDADAHVEWTGGVGPDYAARVHVGSHLFQYGAEELAVALVHEAYHGYFRGRNDLLAESTAHGCVSQWE